MTKNIMGDTDTETFTVKKKKGYLHVINFIKEKIYGKIKECTYANGRTH